jgi:hypothetical protein
LEVVMLAAAYLLNQFPPITSLAVVRLDFIVVCMFSLLGLTLSYVVLSSVPSETIGIMLSQP